jgi:hypothetical protein
MAEYERILATLGAVPAGTKPKTILAGDENQEPGYYQTDPLSNLVRTLKKRKLDIEDKLKKEQEATQKKIDMYKTLRESGYDPKSAYDAVKKNQFPELPGTDEVGKKTSRERILAKIAKGETLTTGEQQVYDDTIKHKETDENLLDETIADKTTETETANQKKMREQILDKIARGTPLTPGEQKIYDEVIKKSQPKVQEDLSTVIKDQEEMIAVIAPDGSKGSVPKSKLARALAAGYKKR